MAQKLNILRDECVCTFKFKTKHYYFTLTIIKLIMGTYK